MKKLISAFMSIVMLFALMVPAFAADFTSTETADSSTASTETQLQTTPYNTQSFNLQNVGDTHILMEDEDGVLFIELTDEYETRSNISRAGTTVNTTKNYNVTYKNWLGIEKVAVQITATATWIDNGSESYIQNLHGEYSVKNNDYSCAWDDNLKAANDYYHALALAVYNGIYETLFMLSATMGFKDIATMTNPYIVVMIEPLKV